jgi:hypothetical protein
MRLERTGRRLVTPELARGKIERYTDEAFRGDVEPLPRDVSTADFDDAIDEVLARTRPFESNEVDPSAAPRIHRALPLTRREASDIGIWRFLAVVHRPDFIRHRWEFRSWATMKTRFWDLGTRPDSNSLYRLWWIAELTATGDDYTLTEQVLRSQSLANPVFIRSLSFFRPAVEAAVEVLADCPSAVVEQVLLKLQRYCSVVPLEGLDREAIAGVLRGWVED